MSPRPVFLDPPADPDRDHVLGPPDAELTLVEYGSYTSKQCHAVHGVIEGLRDRFGDRLRYVYRHMPDTGNANAMHAAVMAEYAGLTEARFWELHEALMERGPAFADGEIERVARHLGMPPPVDHGAAFSTAQARVREDMEGAERSGATVTPTFFINGRPQRHHPRRLHHPRRHRSCDQVLRGRRIRGGHALRA